MKNIKPIFVDLGMFEFVPQFHLFQFFTFHGSLSSYESDETFKKSILVYLFAYMFIL